MLSISTKTIHFIIAECNCKSCKMRENKTIRFLLDENFELCLDEMEKFNFSMRKETSILIGELKDENRNMNFTINPN